MMNAQKFFMGSCRLHRDGVSDSSEKPGFRLAYSKPFLKITAVPNGNGLAANSALERPRHSVNKRKGKFCSIK